MSNNSSNIEQPELVFSVKEYLEAVNLVLAKLRVKITGEVAEVKIAASGHVYFTLKDKEGAGVLDCIIWKYDYKICGVDLREGLEVILSGQGRVYEANGRFSFVAKTVELKGEGALKKAYLELKDKLEKQGIFAMERKKSLPEFPQNIGIITSKQGAVIHDLLNNLGRFGFKITLVDSRVEGQEAVSDLLGAVKTFQSRRPDVLVIMRGGGSLESLQPFNNEALVRAVVNFSCPVIAAIGHDKDVPLLALSADMSCSTPTAAANLLNKSWEQAPLRIHRIERFILEKFSQCFLQTSESLERVFHLAVDNFTAVFGRFKEAEQALKENLVFVQRALLEKNKALKIQANGLVAAFENGFKQVVRQTYFLAKTVQAHNPEKNLALGYCIARKNGKLLRNAQAVSCGDLIDIQLQDGILNSEVKCIMKHHDLHS